MRRSVRSALAAAAQHQLQSLAFPLLGAGNGGLDDRRVLDAMVEELEAHDHDGAHRIVRYERAAA